MDADLLKLLSTGGIAGALLGLIYLVGMRMVRAVDRIAVKVDDHTKADLASHADMREDIAALHGKIDGLLDASDRFTPVGVEPPTPVERRTPLGAYSMRPSTKGSKP